MSVFVCVSVFVWCVCVWWVCVCVCGVCVCVGVCVWFVCVCVWLCILEGFVICGYFDNIYILVFTVLYCLYFVFVLLYLCIFILICSLSTSVSSTAT